jgi:hypothetical protein
MKDDIAVCLLVEGKQQVRIAGWADKPAVLPEAFLVFTEVQILRTDPRDQQQVGEHVFSGST